MAAISRKGSFNVRTLFRPWSEGAFAWYSQCVWYDVILHPFTRVPSMSVLIKHGSLPYTIFYLWIYCNLKITTRISSRVSVFNRHYIVIPWFDYNRIGLAIVHPYCFPTYAKFNKQNEAQYWGPPIGAQIASKWLPSENHHDTIAFALSWPRELGSWPKGTAQLRL